MVKLTDSQRAVVEANLKLVPYTLNRINASGRAGYDYDDLYQEGCLALMQAAYFYSKDSVGSFSTYAVTCIKNRINHILGRPNDMFVEFNDALEYDQNDDFGRAEASADIAVLKKRISKHDDRLRLERGFRVLESKIRGQNIREYAASEGMNPGQAYRAVYVLQDFAQQNCAIA